MEKDNWTQQAPLMDRLHKATDEYTSAMAAANVDTVATKLVQEYQDVVRVHEVIHKTGGKWEPCPGPFQWYDQEHPLPPAPTEPCRLALLERDTGMALTAFLHETTRLGLIAHVSFNTTKGEPA